MRSARYAGETADDRTNVAKLLDALRSVPDGERGARFYCVLVALARPTTRRPLIASGEWQGRIAARRAGAGGFGYDPYSSIRRRGRRRPSYRPGCQESREPPGPGARSARHGVAGPVASERLASRSAERFMHTVSADLQKQALCGAFLSARVLIGHLSL